MLWAQTCQSSLSSIGWRNPPDTSGTVRRPPIDFGARHAKHCAACGSTEVCTLETRRYCVAMTDPRSTVVILAFSIAMLVPAVGVAQGGGASQTGTIDGRVADAQGGALPGVTVTSTSSSQMRGTDDRHERGRRLSVQSATSTRRTASSGSRIARSGRSTPTRRPSPRAMPEWTASTASPTIATSPFTARQTRDSARPRP